MCQDKIVSKLEQKLDQKMEQIKTLNKLDWHKVITKIKTKLLPSITLIYLLHLHMTINIKHLCLKLNNFHYQMDTQTINTMGKVQVLILLILSIIFCVLVLFVLVYYIRRRYKLYKEINRIPQELFIKESYRNHLKNLKLKCFINNFIIVILVIEFIQNLCLFIYYFPFLFKYFVKGFNFGSLKGVGKSTYYSLVPVLTMMMDFLWLAYRKYEYKYTMIRWTWYIVIRILVVLLVQYSIPFSLDYQIIYSFLTCAIYAIFPIIDLLQFVYFARKFYLHLKSREKEIRLFYFDKKAYLDSKYLRIHFKIATILVGTALFFSTLASSTAELSDIFGITDYYLVIPQQLYENLLIIFYFFCFISKFLFLYSKVLFIFNYLYIFIVVAYKFYRDGQKLKNINDYIKPIMKQYHDNYYNRYTNYA